MPCLLLAETEEPILRVTSQWLAPLGFELTACLDTEQALERLQEKPFDYIVLGIHFANLHDLRLRQAAKQQQESHQTRVVLIVPRIPEALSTWLNDGFWADVVMPYVYSETEIQSAVLGTKVD